MTLPPKFVVQALPTRFDQFTLNARLTTLSPLLSAMRFFDSIDARPRKPKTGSLYSERSAPRPSRPNLKTSQHRPFAEA
jgi:hypothetical protein